MTCVFCRIIAGYDPAEIVMAWPAAIAIVPLDPVVDGHIIVMPRAHVEDLTTNPTLTGVVMRHAAQLAIPPCNIITSAGAEATQTIGHLHVHLVPRRAGDGLALPWTGPS